jgi:hypothetical protein
MAILAESMNRFSNLVGLLCATTLLGVSAADAAAQSVSPRPNSFLFQAVRPVFGARTAINAITFARAVEPPALPQWTLKFGVNYADNGDGANAMGTPAELLLVSADQLTSIALDGDIYDWVHTSEGTLKGNGDPSLTGLHTFPFTQSDSLTLGASVTVPTGSPVGTTSASQSGIAVYTHKFKTDEFAKDNFLKDGVFQFWEIVGHSNGSFPPGVNALSWTGQIYYYQNLPKYPDGTDVFITVSRDYREGAGGASTLGIGTDFIICGENFGPFKGIIGTLTGTCGISAGHHCGVVAFNVQLPFIQK